MGTHICEGSSFLEDLAVRDGDWGMDWKCLAESAAQAAG